MIIQEYFYINEKQFIRTYSDEGRYVVRESIAYSEACDPAEFNRQYIEGDLIVKENEEENFEDIIEEKENYIPEVAIDNEEEEE